MKAVGILGGSFNPAHGGHRHVSLEAMRRLQLDEVWWLVSPQNPLKSAAGMAPLPARLVRARQVARHPRIRVSAIEEQLGTRFAVDTVRALKRRWPDVRFVWVMGADILPELHRWRRWRQFAREVAIAVVPRPGHSHIGAQAMAWLARYRRRPTGWTAALLPAIIMLDMPERTDSATAIRRADPDWHLKGRMN